MTPSDRAVLALHLEVSATPTPGNVDRNRDTASLRFSQFQAGAMGARKGLDAIEAGASIGEGFERAVTGAVTEAGTNTHFGALLLLAPLVAATTEDEISETTINRVTTATSVDDAVAFYRAFDAAPVAVPEPPQGWDALDVRRGSDAVPAVRERDLTLRDVLAKSASRDLNANEWTSGFPRTFRTADRIAQDSGSLEQRAARAHLAQLAAEPDTLIQTRHGEDVAAAVRERAAALHESEASVDAISAFAEDLVEREINPGTTADILAAGLYVALLRGVKP